MSKDFSANKGEWSELYVFLELLKDGKLYLADKNFNKMQDRFFEIVRIIRENIDYFTGSEIKIFCNDEYCMSISLDKLEYFSKKLFNICLYTITLLYCTAKTLLNWQNIFNTYIVYFFYK